jgi:hypothetical protein
MGQDATTIDRIAGDMNVLTKLGPGILLKNQSLSMWT